MISPLIPDWPAPEAVKAVITTRQGGVSQAPYHSLNLATHVGDAPEAVEENRKRLIGDCQLPGEPFWLSQVHGCQVADSASDHPGCEADAVFSLSPGVVCAVMTADCLPLLMTDRSGSRVCAVHAGWRGLAQGVVESAINRMGVAPEEIMVWLGPAIGPNEFEVGGEVCQAFLNACSDDAAAFRQGDGDRWLADIYQLARSRLKRLGVGYVGGGEYCTVQQSELFFSYRREGVTGRMASLIWLQANNY
jgi:YfiH family protein